MQRIYIFAHMPKPAILILLLFVSLCVKAQDDRYFTLWNKNQVSVRPWKDVKLTVSDRMHYVPESKRVSVVLGQLAVKHKPKAWFGYGAAFRVSNLQPAEGVSISENRPFVFVDLSKDLNEFQIVFSNRIEYRAYKELSDHFRHKQTLKLDFPALADWGMRFYLSEESFYKMNGVGTHSARFQSGVTALDKDWFAMKVYYILEKRKASDYWLTGDVLGLNLSFSI